MRRRRPRLVLAAAALAVVAVTVGTATGATTVPPAPTYTSTPGGAFAQDAGEPSIAVDWKTGAALFQAGLETDRLTFDSAGRATWSKATPIQTRLITLDPIAASDNATGRVFVSQLVGFGSLMAYSDDDGRTWQASQGSGIPAGADHQTVGAGPYPKEGGSGFPLTTYPHAVYYCSQELGTALCARSDTGGATFGAGVPAYTLEDCLGLHGHVRVAPDGTVYLPNKSCNGRQAVVVSQDAGLTWQVRPVPGSSEGFNGDPSVATGRDGTAYFGFVNGDGTMRVAVSRNRGLSWTRPFDVGRVAGVRNAAFASVIAGDGDRAAVAFLGTRTGGDAQHRWFGTDSTHTRYTGGDYHLYVATTYDRGRTWQTVDVTGRDPVQRGRICLGGTVTCTADDRNLLDFMDIQVDRYGRVVVAWADGCTGACVTSTLVTSNSWSSRGTVTRQRTGTRLFATPQRTK